MRKCGRAWDSGTQNKRIPKRNKVITPVRPEPITNAMSNQCHHCTTPSTGFSVATNKLNLARNPDKGGNPVIKIPHITKLMPKNAKAAGIATPTSSCSGNTIPSASNASTVTASKSAPNWRMRSSKSTSKNMPPTAKVETNKQYNAAAQALGLPKLMPAINMPVEAIMLTPAMRRKSWAANIPSDAKNNVSMAKPMSQSASV